MTFHSAPGIKTTAPPLIMNDHQCFVSRTHKSSSVAALLRHPAWLLDEYMIPAIHLGPLAVPAPAFPVLVAVGFLYWRFSRVGRRRNTEPRAGVEARRTDRRPSRPAENDWDARRLTFLFHAIVTGGAYISFGRSFLPLDVLACCEVAAALLHGEFVQPAARKSCLAGALGWCLISFAETSLPEDASFPTLCAVLGLAAPMAWQVEGPRRKVNLEQSGSGVLLMLLAGTRGLVFANQDQADEWRKGRSVKVGLFLSGFQGLNALMALWFHRKDSASARDDAHPPWTAEEAVKKLKLVVTMLAQLLGLVAALLCPLVVGVLCTTFLSSCLPWNSLLFDKCAVAPSLSKYSLLVGFFIYQSLWAICRLLEQHPDARHYHTDKGFVDILRGEIFVTASLLGWSCALLVVLWATAPRLLELCRWLDADNA